MSDDGFTQRGQLELFGEAERRHARVSPADPGEEVRALGRALPPGVRLGTSSWSFPGWRGIVWAHEESQRRLAREGLTAYARHPLLGCVGVDRSYYAPLAVEDWAAYAAQVPADFRFVAKAWETLVWGRFPAHPRFGERAGQGNPHCLDPHVATEQAIGPALEGLGPKLGAIVFQLPPQASAALGGARGFPVRLARFLAALPAGPVYAVELRDPRLLTRDYEAALADTGAVHCLNVHPTMPEPAQQLAATARAKGPRIVRWMLRAGDRYEDARSRLAPFDRLAEPDAPTRKQVASLLLRASDEGAEAWVIANNKAEGSAPLTLAALAREIAQRGRDAAEDAPADPLVSKGAAR